MSKHVTKKEFDEIVKQEASVSSLVAAVDMADAVVRSIVFASGKGTLVIRGFGTFRTKIQPARTRRNPRTGEPVNVPAREVLTFKMSKNLRRD